MKVTHNIQATLTGIIVKRLFLGDGETRTEAGIIIQDKPDEDKNLAYGQVLSVGEKVEHTKVGDVLLFVLPQAKPLPNGVGMRPELFKIDEFSTQVIGKIPISETELANG